VCPPRANRWPLPGPLGAAWNSFSSCSGAVGLWSRQGPRLGWRSAACFPCKPRQAGGARLDSHCPVLVSFSAPDPFPTPGNVGAYLRRYNTTSAQLICPLGFAYRRTVSSNAAGLDYWPWVWRCHVTPILAAFEAGASRRGGRTGGLTDSGETLLALSLRGSDWLCWARGNDLTGLRTCDKLADVRLTIPMTDRCAAAEGSQPGISGRAAVALFEALRRWRDQSAAGRACVSHDQNVCEPTTKRAVSGKGIGPASALLLVLIGFKGGSSVAALKSLMAVSRWPRYLKGAGAG